MFESKLRECLTFDDVLLTPAYSDVLPTDVDVSARFTQAIPLNIPIASAAMDSVTEARLAVSIAREGGIGIVHKNLSPHDQAAEVDAVKRAESGIISTLSQQGRLSPYEKFSTSCGGTTFRACPSSKATRLWAS